MYYLRRTYLAMLVHIVALICNLAKAESFRIHWQQNLVRNVAGIDGEPDVVTEHNIKQYGSRVFTRRSTSPWKIQPPIRISEPFDGLTALFRTKAFRTKAIPKKQDDEANLKIQDSKGTLNI